MQKAEALLMCIALECRDLSGRYMRAPRVTNGSIKPHTEIETRLRRLRESAGNVRTQFMLREKNTLQRMQVFAAHAIAAAQSAELVQDINALDPALESLVYARQDATGENALQLASAHCSVAKVAITRGKFKTAYRICLRWRRLAEKGLALKARGQDASRLGAAVTCAAFFHKNEYLWHEEKVILEIALRLGKSLPISFPFDGGISAVSGCVLDAARRCMHSNNKELYERTLILADQAEAMYFDTPQNDMHESYIYLLRSIIITARSRAGQDKILGLEEALQFPNHVLDEETITAALEQAVDYTKNIQQRLVDKLRQAAKYDDSSFHNEDEEDFNKYDQSLKQLRRGLDLVPFQPKKKEQTVRQGSIREGRGDPGIQTARARAFVALGDFDAALNEAPHWSPPNLRRIAATARIGARHNLWISLYDTAEINEHFKLKSAAKSLIKFYQAMTRRIIQCLAEIRTRPKNERSVSNHKSSNMLAQFIAEIMRSIAVLVNEPYFFWGPAKKNAAEILADWAITFSIQAAQGYILDTRFKSSLINNLTANALLEILVAVSRHNDARHLLTAMRRDPNTTSFASFSTTDSPKEQFDGLYPRPDAFTYNIFLRDMLIRRTYPDTSQNIRESIEDILTALTNDGLKPNADTIDILLSFFSEQQNDPATAITFIQDFFNQYESRPSPISFVHFLASLLEKGEHDEARRAVYVLDQLWPLDHNTNTRDADMLTNDELYNLFEHYGASLHQS
uniref:Uncharacterized protein n=1 Tax=Aureoumbra lagunensis TaxID=44058 RepID=A0A7S3JWZ6_9STRA